MKAKTKWSRGLGMILGCVMMLVLFPITALAEGEGVAINKENFPDEKFREIVKGFDDGNNILSDEEIGDVTAINCYYAGISSLKGVEYFTALEILTCDGNQLTSLDVSKNTVLKELYCRSNQLTSLDVSKNTGLVYLLCGKNQLTSLDVSKNTMLKWLDCGDNQLTGLDVSKNTVLYDLDCRDNQLTSLDVSKNTALYSFKCYNNELTSLDVSKNTALNRLECHNNQLTSLDVSKSTDLNILWCHYNQLTSLDVSKNTGLYSLYCGGNQLTSLDVSKITMLGVLDCSDNYREVEVGHDRLLDLSTLPDFDLDKASNWNGCTINGNSLHFNNDADTATYRYDCGASKFGLVTFELLAKIPPCVFDQEIVRSEALKTLADCTHDAVYYKSCSCGEVSKAETDIFTAANTALGHNFNQKIVNDEALKTPADCTHDAVYFKSCSCGEISKAETDIFNAANTALGHDWTTDWGQDADKHWHECKRCGEKKDEAAHSLKTTVTPATMTKAGKSETVCTVCAKVTDTKTIAAIKTVKLLTTTFVYDGKTKTPKLTVKDSEGKTIPATYYAVKKSKGCKEVGRYTYKITFKGNYKGTKTLTFTINPKGTTLVSVKAESKGFTVKWKKQTAQTTGYEIRFATNQKMDKAKTVKITKNGETSKKITKLAAKKKYYVQIRTYKKVGSKTYYSDWSKTKTVTTRK